MAVNDEMMSQHVGSTRGRKSRCVSASGLLGLALAVLGVCACGAAAPKLDKLSWQRAQYVVSRSHTVALAYVGVSEERVPVKATVREAPEGHVITLFFRPVRGPFSLVAYAFCATVTSDALVKRRPIIDGTSYHADRQTQALRHSYGDQVTAREIHFGTARCPPVPVTVVRG